MKKMLFLIKFVFSFCLFIFPVTLFGSDVLQQIDVLDNLRFNSSASDGKHFIFTRYDTTGNRYELIFYDLKEKKVVKTIPDLSTDTHYLFSDDKYIFLRDGNIFSPNNKLVIIDQLTLKETKKIDLEDGGVRQAFHVFTIEQKLYVIQTDRFDYKTLCFIYDLTTFNLVSKKALENSYSYFPVNRSIIGIGKEITVYDKDFNPLRHTDNKLQCQLGMSGTIKNRIFFSDICGRIYEYNLKANERKTVFDLGALDIPSGLHKFASLNFDINDDGLLIAVHSNKESYPKLIDIKSGRLLKTLTIKNIPDYIMIDNERLYFIFSDWLGKKSKIEIYAYDKSLLLSDTSYIENLKRAYERALKLYRETKDFYKAIDILENADIQLIIKGNYQVDDADKVNLLNDYAYFLFLTYDRYKEAIPILEQAIQLSKDRTSAYINMADTYYKLYKYERAEKETLQKAKDYYETYKRLMSEKGTSKNILKRNFIDLKEKSLVKKLNIAINGTNSDKLLFWKDKIFVGKYDCYSSNSTGNPKVYVYNRNNYSLIKELRISECDGEQQDTISSLTVKDNKLFIETAYRYENNKRPNFFIYDLKTFKNIEKYHKKTGHIKKNFINSNISHVVEGDTEHFELSGKTFERIKGAYIANNKKHLITRSIPHREKKFHIYNLLTLEKDEDIELFKENAIFYLFDDSSDKIAIQYHKPPKTIIEIYDVKSKQRKNILSFDNDSGRLTTIAPLLQSYKHYLIIAYRRDLIFYDTKKMEITEIAKNVIPEYETEGEKKNGRVGKLIIDNEKQRLLLFKMAYGQDNSYIELDFLKN